MKSRLVLASIVALLMSGPLGCGDDDPVTPEQLLGEYTLLQVNGMDLPATTWTAEGLSEEATAGQLVLATAPTGSPTDMAGGRYTIRLELRTNAGGGTAETSLVDQGLWTLDGSALSFDSDSPTLAWTGTMVDGVLVLEMDRMGLPEPRPRFMFTR